MMKSCEKGIQIYILTHIQIKLFSIGFINKYVEGDSIFRISFICQVIPNDSAHDNNINISCLNVKQY